MFCRALRHPGRSPRQQADRDRRDRCGAGGDGDRHVEPAPVKPGRAGGDRARQPRRQSRRAALLSLKRSGPMREHQREAGGREHAADEAQQQQDRGQRHASLGGEEQGQPPRGRRDQQRRERGRAVDVDGQAGRLADPLADPAEREQQDRRGDRDENVVEAGDAAGIAPRRRMLVVRWRSTCARSASAASALITPAATASSSSCWLYMPVPPVVGGRISSVYYSVNTARRLTRAAAAPHEQATHVQSLQHDRDRGRDAAHLRHVRGRHREPAAVRRNLSRLFGAGAPAEGRWRAQARDDASGVSPGRRPRVGGR